MRILVVNAGSSSLKLRVLDDADAVIAAADAPAVREGAGAEALVATISALGPVDAVGHRIVHGGSSFTGRPERFVISRLSARTSKR